MNYLGQEIKQILPGNVAIGGANMGMVPLFAVMWCPNRAGIWAGYVAADGQELDDNLFPDAAAGIAANNVPTTSNANWLADPTARGAYVAGSSAGKFRVPDYNGKFAGSLGAVFLRGDGTLSAAVAGVIQQDAFKSHSHTLLLRSQSSADNHVVQDVPAGRNSSATGPNSSTAAVLGEGGDETRPLNVTGCWVIKLFGAVTNVASADAAQLASSYANLTSRVTTLEGVRPVLRAAVAASGTAIDFTGIPSWAKRITLTLNGVSTNGTSYFAVRVGNSGGIVSTGYACTVANNAAGSSSQAGNTATEHALFAVSTTAAGIHNSTVTFVSTEPGKWQISSTLGIAGGTSVCLSHSAITISGLDRIRLTTALGADQFDAGSANIMYEE